MLQKLFYFTVAATLFVSCKNDDQRIQPRLGTITESVYASVTLQPDSLYAAYAAVNGIVAQVFVKEGELVRRGDKLIQITNDASELNAENTRLSLELARKNYEGKAALLKEIKENIEVARLQLRQDSLNFFRQKNLWEKKIGTQNDYDARKTAYEIARKNLEALKNRYDRTQNELETQYKQAEISYKTAQVVTGDYTVNSKIDGKVYEVFKEPGELVSQQEPIASIGSSGKFIIELLIDEVDIARVEKGQRVLITLDAYTDQVYSAILTKIYPKKDERTQTFTAEARFEELPDKLYPGLSGEANIIISQKENALIIPRSYLVNEYQVKTEEGIVKVETGLYSMEEIEILSGLDTGTYIYKP